MTVQEGSRWWYAIDQGLSSGTSFLAAVLTAGLLNEVEFGGWAIAFAVALVIQASCRSLIGDAAMLLLPAANQLEVRVQSSGAIGLSLLFGFTLAPLLAVASMLVGGATQTALLYVAICLPGLLAHDAIRFVLLSTRRPMVAALLDASWLTISTLALIAIKLTNAHSVGLITVSWAAGSIPPAAVGIIALGAHPQRSAIKRWIDETRHLSPTLFANHLAYIAASLTMVTIVIGLTHGAYEAGSVRAGLTILGVVPLAITAATLYVQPLLVRRAADRQAIVPVAIQMSLWAGFATLIGVAAVWFMPDSLGTRILGASWHAAHAITIELGSAVLAGAIASGAIVALRSRGNVATVAVVTAVSAVVAVPLVFITAREFGFETSLWAYSCVLYCAAVALWHRLLVNHSISAAVSCADDLITQGIP